MEDNILLEFVVPKHILQPLLNATNCSTLDDALETLIKSARNDSGRSELASKNTILDVLALTKFLSTLSSRCILLSSLKLLRNLCAGEIRNQRSFIANNGIEIISTGLACMGFGSDSDYGIFRTSLQLLGNVSLAGEENQRAIWLVFFPDQFREIARIQKSEICDPLCMVIYSCCSGSNELAGELQGVQGSRIVAEIIRTASIVGFGEEWLKWLLSKICFEEYYFHTLFYQLNLDEEVATGEDINGRVAIFSEGQAFLLGVLSESLNQETDEVSVSNECTMCVFGILKKALATIDFFSRGTSSLPTGIPTVDVLGYSIIILRDVCAKYGQGSSSSRGSINIVDSLISSGFLELLLKILHDLEPPEILRKSISRGENQDTSRAHDLLMKCPYKGFRRDIVAIIGNCVYRRKHAQDEIREKNGILLLMQQCVTEEDNPFLREWGIWSVRNLLEGNEENKREVAELELLGSVDVPEIAGLGLRVEIDQKTRHPKLINVP